MVHEPISPPVRWGCFNSCPRLLAFNPWIVTESVDIPAGFEKTNCVSHLWRIPPRLCKTHWGGLLVGGWSVGGGGGGGGGGGPPPHLKTAVLGLSGPQGTGWRRSWTAFEAGTRQTLHHTGVQGHDGHTGVQGHDAAVVGANGPGSRPVRACGGPDAVEVGRIWPKLASSRKSRENF